MNIDIEKIAGFADTMNTVKNTVIQNRGAYLGGAIGSTTAVSLGSLEKNRLEYNPKTGRLERIPLTKTERILGGVVNGLAGGYIGAGIGHSFDRVRNFNEQMRKARSSYGGGGSDSSGSSSGKSNSWDDYRRYAGASRGARSTDDLHKVLGKPGGFKTKKEAMDHFRRMRSANHPDRAGGNAERMKELNQAWDEYQKHPGGFNKLAFLMKSAAIDSKKVLDFVKANPATALFTVGGAADGAASATKKPNEAELKYRLRQARNTVGGGLYGGVAGAVTDMAIRRFSK